MRSEMPSGPGAPKARQRSSSSRASPRRLVLTAERCQQRRGVGAPGAERGRTDVPLFLETAAVEQILERVLRVLKGRS